ncbi:MAG: exodeoxyribonuclease VII large subunit [Actinomycetes bacterium]|nr:exodeoxyribonuclease VII large subunit [Actinomycetes bacterium]
MSSDGQLSLDAEFEAANAAALALNERRLDDTSSGSALGGDGAATREPALSVGEAMNIAKRGLETIRLRVSGEVSDSTGTRYPSLYFSLKDKDAVMNCTIWKNVRAGLDVDIQNGMQIEVEGKFSAWPKKGTMQFQVARVEVAGEGALRAQLARLERQLRAEGLFSPARKQLLPAWPARIALVTSPAGDAVHDVLRTLARRWPLAELLFFGTRVEGADAPEQIRRALEAADASDAELILLVRGGGSFEDLLVFSDEALVRFAATLQKPLVTGIGHEPDNNLIDYVADVRASTPTAAAEAVSPDVAEVQARLTLVAQGLATALERSVAVKRMQLERLASRALFRDAAALFAERAQTLDWLSGRLRRATEARLERDAARLKAAVGTLDALSPLKVLSRGYAAVFDENTGVVVDSVTKVQTGDVLRVRVADGSLKAKTL